MELTDPIQYLKGIGPKKAEQMARLGIYRIYDLLTYYPRAYEDQSRLTPISDLQAGEKVTVTGTVMSTRERVAGKRRLRILTALIGDGTGF